MPSRLTPATPPRPVRVGVFVHSIFSFAREILRGIAEQCPSSDRLEYQIPFPLDRPWWEHNLDRMDGLIIRIENADDPSLQMGLDRPRVLIANAPIDGVPIDLTWNNASAGRLAAEHFLELGHTQFAFVGRLQWPYHPQRLAGFQKAIEAQGHAIQVLDIGPRQESHVSCQELIADWLVSLEPGTGLLAATDALGQDVLVGAHAIGLAVPEDLAVVTVGNDELFCGMSGPPLSAVSLPGRALGRAAARLLTQRLEAGDTQTGPTQQIAASVLEQRRSSDLVRVEDPCVAQAVELIRARATSGLAVPEIHAVVPLSRRALEMRFKKLIGRTMQQEICRLQVAEAKRLLTQTRLSMAEIADAAGFPNAQRLSVVFAREAGQSPIEYRRRTQSSR